jgi:hypothetical protein
VSGRRLIFFVAIFQFIPLLLYPPQVLLSINPIFLVIVALLLVLVGWQLVQGGASWAPILSTFLQGFNIITRLILLFPHALVDEGAGGVNYLFLTTGVLAILLSIYFLYLLGRPEIEAGMA